MKNIKVGQFLQNKAGANRTLKNLRSWPGNQHEKELLPRLVIWLHCDHSCQHFELLSLDCCSWYFCIYQLSVVGSLLSVRVCVLKILNTHLSQSKILYIIIKLFLWKLKWKYFVMSTSCIRQCCKEKVPFGFYYWNYNTSVVLKTCLMIYNWENRIFSVVVDNFFIFIERMRNLYLEKQLFVDQSYKLDW